MEQTRGLEGCDSTRVLPANSLLPLELKQEQIIPATLAQPSKKWLWKASDTDKPRQEHIKHEGVLPEQPRNDSELTCLNFGWNTKSGTALHQEQQSNNNSRGSRPLCISRRKPWVSSVHHHPIPSTPSKLDIDYCTAMSVCPHFFIAFSGSFS